MQFTDHNFNQEIEIYNGLALVDFFAEWCGPCKLMGPVIEELSKEYENKVKIGKLNVDENKNIAEKYNIMSIPTLIIFQNGKPIQTITGYAVKEQLKEAIDKYL